MIRRALAAAAAVAGVSLGAWLLTPEEAYGHAATIVRDLKTGRTWTERDHVWRADGTGAMLREHEPSGTIVGRYVSRNDGGARYEVEFRSWRRRGVFVAPQLGGRELFRIDSGDADQVSVRLYLAEATPPRP